MIAGGIGPSALQVIAALPLLVAAAVKLRSPGPAAIALVRVGVSTRVSPVRARILGSAEGTLAVAILVVPAIGGVIATGLYIAFAVVVARSLARGGSFECACFGRAETTGRWTVVRAALLGIVALAASLSSRPIGPPNGVGVTLGVATLAAVVALRALLVFRPFSAGGARP